MQSQQEIGFNPYMIEFYHAKRPSVDFLKARQGLHSSSAFIALVKSTTEKT